MKTIRDFLQGKLRRAEVEDRLSLQLEGPADPELGPHEATLVSAVGQLDFYRDGLRAADGQARRYVDLERVELSPPGDEAWVELQGVQGNLRLRSSPAGALVVHATLRWVGHALLRRPLA